MLKVNHGSWMGRGELSAERLTHINAKSESWVKGGGGECINVLVQKDQHA